MSRREALVVDSDGEQIGVEVAGSGPAVVLLHGAGGNRATWWQQVVRLAATHTVVVVEARGAGRSTDRAAQSGPVAGVRDLEAVRVRLGVEQWHLVGHSLGGWTALRYAATHPARVTSCLLVASVAGVFPPEVDAHWQRFTADLAATGWPAQELARPASLTAAFCAEHPERAHLYQLVGAVDAPLSPEVPAARIRDHDLTPADLAAVTAPVRFVSGQLDLIAPDAVVQAAALAASAEHTSLARAGHVPFWEDPEGFAALLRDWLA